jgi:hypothetical protein
MSLSWLTSLAISETTRAEAAMSQEYFTGCGEMW